MNSVDGGAGRQSTPDTSTGTPPGPARPKPKLADWQRPSTRSPVAPPPRRWRSLLRRGLLGRTGEGAGDRQVFRLPGPVAVWWVWSVFLLANLIDLAVSGRDWDSLVVFFVLALITGVLYALAFRPRVITDKDGVKVQNPFRDHQVPWGAVNSVVVGESVQLHCVRPASDKEKVVHSWALYATRRSRIKKGPRGRGRGRPSLFQAPAPPLNSKLPKEAQELLRKSPCDQVADELSLKAKLARDSGAAGGTWSASWPWQPTAAVLLPAAALAITLLVH